MTERETASTEAMDVGATEPNFADKLKKYAMVAPQLVKLVWGVARDPRVPARTKAVLFVVAGYLASPIDLIPDFIAGIGVADDLLVAAFALDQVLNRIPSEVLRDHWEGDGDVLQVIQEVVDIASGFVPSRVKKILGGR